MSLTTPVGFIKPDDAEDVEIDTINENYDLADKRSQFSNNWRTKRDGAAFTTSSGTAATLSAFDSVKIWDGNNAGGAGVGDEDGITYSSGAFTVPFDGWYFYNAHVTWASVGTAAGNRELQVVYRIGQSGEDVIDASFMPGSTLKMSQRVTGEVALQAGDQFGFRILQDSGSPIGLDTTDIRRNRMGLSLRTRTA